MEGNKIGWKEERKEERKTSVLKNARKNIGQSEEEIRIKGPERRSE